MPGMRAPPLAAGPRKRPCSAIAWTSRAGRWPPSSINLRLATIKKLAAEAADNALLAPEIAAAIGRVHGAKRLGVRTGNWLTRPQAQELIEAPDPGTLKGLRDRALLALLLGCGLRRGELAPLGFSAIAQRESRWVIVDLIGKHGRIRTVPMPSWAKAALDRWGPGRRHLRRQSAAGHQQGWSHQP